VASAASGHRDPPGRQRSDADRSPPSIECHDVDREAHAHRVHAATARQQQRCPGIDPIATEQTTRTLA
jgi:hypothetical protein